VTGTTLRTSYRRDMRLVQTNAMRVWIVVLAAFAIYLPFALRDRSFLGIELSSGQILGLSLTEINLSLIAIIGAVGLNLLTGYTGLISLGNAAFFAIGAMTVAVVTVQWGAPFYVGFAAAGVVGGVVGAVVGLPSLRVRGLYLLMATLALHFIVIYLYIRYEQRYFQFTGVLFDRPEIGPWTIRSDLAWYFLILPVVAVVLLLTKNILRTRTGRAFVAVRDNDVAAAAAGINVSATKVVAFAASSFIVSLAGAFYVYYLGSANQDLFTLGLAITFIAMIIIGGMGTLTGAVLGALVWQLLPELIVNVSGSLSAISPSIEENATKYESQISSIVLGVIVILVLVFQPAGLAGLWRSVKRAFVRWPFTS
jgi:branched-chain amino acid transport system permease protein